MSCTIDWDVTDARRWSALLADCGQSAIEQSWAYGEAVAGGSGYRVRRGVVKRGRDVLGLVQLFDRPLLGPLQLGRIMRGPAMLPDLDSMSTQAAFSAIAADWPTFRGKLLFWMPERRDTPESRAMMSAIGKRRMVTGYSSIWLDLRQGEPDLRRGLDRQFRRALAKAEAARIKIDLTQGGAQLDWLLTQHDTARKARGYVAPGGALVHRIVEAQPNRRDVLLATAYDGSTPIAAMLFFRHGASANYYVGVTSPAGRLACAHHLLLWRAILDLKGRGVTWLDLGGLNTDTMAGVAGFKLGVGGECFTLAGTFL